MPLRSLKNDYFDTKSLTMSKQYMIVAPFITLILTPLEQKLVDYSLHNQSSI